jgi:hypothetical protein
VGGITNAKRADDGLEPIAAYGLRNGLKGEDLETVASDMFSSVLHLAAACGLSPAEFLENVYRRAWGHYIAESTTDPHEGDKEPEFAKRPIYNAKDILGKIDRHFIVQGRVPGDDDDSVAYIRVSHRDKRSAWEVFVEEVLYGGEVVSVRKWNSEWRKNGYPPEGIPRDWIDRDPREGETRWDSWAYSGEEFEITGPPLDNHE